MKKTKNNNHIIEFLVCPWKDNPAKPENFYRIDENFENEFLEKKETFPKFIDVRKVKNASKRKDPYSDILEDLR